MTDQSTINPSRCFLRYFGGKFRLAPWIISFFPSHRIYVEPFGGAGSVLLKKSRSYSEIYNDLDNDVVNLFLMARERGPELMYALKTTPYSRLEFELALAFTECPLERARRLVVRSFMGYGSDAIKKTSKTGFRTGVKRRGTTPAHDWAGLPGAYQTIIDRLRGVVIENLPATEIIRKNDYVETLIYCDPPYVSSTRGRSKHHGYNYQMTDDEHRELARILQEARGMIILSGYPSSLYDEDLYRTWHRVERTAFAEGARVRTEVLWINEAAWTRKRAETGELI